MQICHGHCGLLNYSMGDKWRQIVRMMLLITASLEVIKEDMESDLEARRAKDRRRQSRSRIVYTTDNAQHDGHQAIQPVQNFGH
jgi:hypothetical protein